MASQLPTRQLGKNGPQVTSIGLGLMGFSVFYNTKLEDSERFKFLDEAYALGERHWDSADMYGDCEDILGKWFEKNPDKRDKIFLTTKFANRTHPDGSRSVDSSPEYAIEACNKSLKRLGLKQVDLYYCHRVDGKTPVEKTIEAMVQLKNEGKIKYLGISECSADTLRRAHAVHPMSAVQIEYSPFTLDIESDQMPILKTARELGVAVVAYSPVGRGMLSGNFRSPDDFEEGDFRKHAPRFSPENFPNNLKLVDKIVDIAKTKGVTPVQLTLAWLLAQGDDIIPIPGTTKVDRLKENTAAAAIRLTASEEGQIRAACEAAEIRGLRYPEPMTKVLFGDTPPLKA